MKTDTLLFGAAYYDEYLPYDRIETDMAMMEKAHINVIRIAESTWSTWEPQEGVFDFTHLHRMLQASCKHGIQVIVGTPTYAVPTWLAAKYPDIITQTHQGPERYGRRQNMDIAHPMYLKHAEIIIRRLMEEAAPYSHVIGFQLDNETKAYDTCSAYAQAKFVEYLKELFHNDLDALNHEFGLDYWSNRINAWEDFPDVRGTINASLGAEYQKFQRKLVTDFLSWQSAIVKEYARPEQFITQNFDYEWRGISVGLQPDVNQWEAAKSLTVAGCDIYHLSAQDLTGSEIAFGGAIAHSIKKDNYLVLETEAQGNPGWLPYPGQLRLQAFSHLASGANSVMYWHWHSIHNAIESYWKGVLSHNLQENATYREVCQIGADFAKYGSHLKNLKKKASVALLLSHESLNGLQWFPIHETLHYNDIFRWIYDALYQMNIECDILCDADTDLFGQYSLLITPALYSVSDTTVTALRAYVENGGHLLSTFKTAFADPMLKIYADNQPHGMTDVFGMTYDQFTNAVNVGLRDLRFAKMTETVSDECEITQPDCVHYWMELLKPDTAETLASYAHLHWGEYAAITHNHYYQGSATYLGCYCEQSILKELLRFLCTEAGVSIPEEQYPVIIKRGVNDWGKEIVYYLNYSDEVRQISYHGKEGTLLLKDKPVKDGDRIALGAWDLEIVER
ncbi:MAG: beta-galactosidase [Blautia sp.]|nr:beta-galactosidase [Lachnoclostridium sp.]MCM1211066.1 beta-galactosidase [Blautia sp.]